MNFEKFKWKNTLRKLEKAMGRFWPMAAALTADGLPWLWGLKVKSGLLDWPTGPAHGSTLGVVTAPT
jgi:hypothetical protein